MWDTDPSRARSLSWARRALWHRWSGQEDDHRGESMSETAQPCRKRSSGMKVLGRSPASSISNSFWVLVVTLVGLLPLLTPWLFTVKKDWRVRKNPNLFRFLLDSQTYVIDYWVTIGYSIQRFKSFDIYKDTHFNFNYFFFCLFLFMFLFTPYVINLFMNSVRIQF